MKQCLLCGKVSPRVGNQMNINASDGTKHMSLICQEDSQ